MDFLKKAANDFAKGNETNNTKLPEGEGVNQTGGKYPLAPPEKKSFLDSIGDKFNSAAGGGPKSEKNEDYLDKAVDLVQERILGQGKQDNESAVEQAKDEQISDYIRDQYKKVSGTDFPVKDKETRFG